MQVKQDQDLCRSIYHSAQVEREVTFYTFISFIKSNAMQVEQDHDL